MKARARLVAGPGGPASAAVLCSDPPVVLRPAGDAVYLAQGAAGPLGGDCLELDVEVPAGRCLRLRAVAGSVVLPSRCGGPAHVRLRARVGDGARLEILLEPVVVADGAYAHLSTRVALGSGARLLWREEVVLGRHGERGGRVVTRVDVDLAGRPLLRTGIDLRGGDPVTRAASVLGAHRAFGSLLAVNHGAGRAARRVERSAAELALPGPGTLLTVAGDSALEVRRRLDAHLADLGARTATAQDQPRRAPSQSRNVRA